MEDETLDEEVVVDLNEDDDPQWEDNRNEQ